MRRTFLIAFIFILSIFISISFAEGKIVKLDANKDGIIDRVEYYDDKGNLVKVEACVDNDCKPEKVTYHNKDGEIVKIGFDRNDDRQIDEWITYKEGKPVNTRKGEIGGDKMEVW